MKQVMGYSVGIGILLLTVLAAAWIISGQANHSSTLELVFGGSVLTAEISNPPCPVESVQVAMDYSDAQKRTSRLMKMSGHDGTSMAFQGKMFKGTPFETVESHGAKFELYDDGGETTAAVFMTRIENELSACLVFADGGTSVVQRITLPIPPDSPLGATGVQLSTNQFPNARSRSSMSSNRLSAQHLTTDADQEAVRPFYTEQLDLPPDLNSGMSRTGTNDMPGFVVFPGWNLQDRAGTGLIRIQSNEVEVVFLLPRSSKPGTHVFIGKMN